MNRTISKRCTGVLLALALLPATLDISHVSALGEDVGAGICINEICAKNTTIAYDEGEYFDWIELYNSTDEVVDLGGYGLSEKEKKPFKYVIPDGTIIQPKGYLVIYCDKDYSANDVNVASFSLSTEGETVLLTTPDGSVTVDKVTYKEIKKDVSYGRIPDGGNEFAIMEMSPGESNQKADEIVASPVFSYEGGFYEDGFRLTLDAQEDCRIYYTLDGSDPTTDSCLYDGGIDIYDRTTDDNNLSNRTDISTYEEYLIPDYSIDKATVIKAISVNCAGVQSEVVANTYFVCYSDRADYYKDWKIISIITDSNNLFGDENGDGLYLLGRTYNEWINSSRYNPSSLRQFWPANYMNEGREWERQAVFQVIENGGMQLSQNVGIRIHGGATRCYNQKSFNIYARSEYGKKKIEYDFFDEGTQKYDSLILRNGGNDRRGGRFRDKLNQLLVQDRAFLTQKMEPCIVFINGEYWGHYEITEKISSDFVKKYTGIDEEDLFLMKNDEVEEGTQEDYEEFEAFQEWIKNTDFSDEDNYKQLCESVDIQDYIDYICANIYIGNTDWVTNNTSWFKEKDGKYRFIMFDTENGGMPQTSVNVFEHLRTNDNFISYIYRGAMYNEEFRKQFCMTFMDIANCNFDSENVTSVIDGISSSYEEAVLDTFKRFYRQYSNDITYAVYVDCLKWFYNERFDVVMQQLKDEFNLEGCQVNIAIENDGACGTVNLNTAAVKINENNRWTGKYFTGYTVNVTVEPKSGHEFAYIELSDGTRIFETSVSINLEEDVTIKVVYDVPDDVRVAGHSISLAGNIIVNFYMELADDILENKSDYKMQFILPSGKVVGVDVPESATKAAGKEYYVFSCNVAARDMTGDIEAKLMKNGRTFSREYTYTVREYADYILENSTDDELKLLVSTMLNYGGYTQIFFNYNTDKPANNGISLDMDNVEVESNLYVVDDTNGLDYAGTYLRIKSNTSLRHYFMLADETDINDFTFIVNDVAVTPREKNGMYYIDIRDIPVNNLDIPYIVAVGATDIQTSVNDYIADVIADENADGNLKNTVKALYLYGNAAKTYVEKWTGVS